MATLSSLPNELLISIFSYVAADVRQGHITATLSPVCSSFHRLIQSSGLDVMYTYLRGTDKTQKFLDLVRKRDMGLRRVDSLLLVVAGNEDNDTASYALSLSLIEAILSTINTSHLHTLFIHVFPRSNDVLVLRLPVALPALADLHLSGLIAISPNEGPLCTPNLERVQLLCLHGLPSEHRNLPRLIHNLAPNITRLNLSVRSAYNLDLPKDMLVFRRSVMSHGQSFPHRFPPSLRQIVASFTCEPRDTRAQSYLTMLAASCTRLNKTSLEPGQMPALVVVQPRKGHPEYVPRRGEEDQGDVAYVDNFVRTWKNVSVLQA
ncbi:hypothetical protein EIP91_008042 [Steccherinum ochraceum]|uniref:F-box domain-containing protein n=1 Tax=Steccherinum ochraceum TaxID=92696 RepID=A0A4R0R3C3_9APHY|nr:hypothetical protein EIP91_008042 [Steccherinum ochraceum]